MLFVTVEGNKVVPLAGKGNGVRADDCRPWITAYSLPALFSFSAVS